MLESWADLFKQAGAKYVVVVSKHHDGFVMYDTKVENPRMPGYNLDFDHVGNLAAACRKRGMRFGVYYSSLIDWTFTKKPIDSAGDLFLSNDNSRTYCDYCFNHWKGIIDITARTCFGAISDTLPRVLKSFAYYYKAVPGSQ